MHKWLLLGCPFVVEGAQWWKGPSALSSPFGKATGSIDKGSALATKSLPKGPTPTLGVNFSTFECWGDISILVIAACVQSPAGEQETIQRFHVASALLLFQFAEGGLCQR